MLVSLGFAIARHPGWLATFCGLRLPLAMKMSHRSKKSASVAGRPWLGPDRGARGMIYLAYQSQVDIMQPVRVLAASALSAMNGTLNGSLSSFGSHPLPHLPPPYQTPPPPLSPPPP